MSFAIIWSREAEITITKNMDYLAKEWNKKVLNQFLGDVESAIKKIKKNPQSYPLYLSSIDVHKIRINKRIELYYKIVDNFNIELITFWNTYQNPDNLLIK